MTTLMVVDGFSQGETRSQAVTRRLREELARHKTTVAAVARSLGEVQQKYSRKMTNTTPWDVDSLDRFCAAFGGDFNYVTTGARELPPPPPPGGGMTPFVKPEASRRTKRKPTGWYAVAS